MEDGNKDEIGSALLAEGYCSASEGHGYDSLAETTVSCCSRTRPRCECVLLLRLTRAPLENRSVIFDLSRAGLH